MSNARVVGLLVLAVLWLPACPPAGRARGQTAHSVLSPLTVSVDAAFTLIGSQRFILLDRADAEQYLFVDASSSREVRRFVWVQFERFLPATEGRYEYPPEGVVVVDHREFITSVRQYTEPPDPGSDRSHAYALAASRGYNMPPIATRARLVHVSQDGRSELMIVYAERAAPPRESSSEDPEGLIQRAAAVVSVSLTPTRSTPAPE